MVYFIYALNDFPKLNFEIEVFIHLESGRCRLLFKGSGIKSFARTIFTVRNHC
jgi:hypothetical protein